MKFTEYLEKTGEVGFVHQVNQSVVFVTGLPGVAPGESVVFESDDTPDKLGEVGYVLSLGPKYAEVLLFTTQTIAIGTRVARLNMPLAISIGDDLIGHTVDALGRYPQAKQRTSVARVIDTDPVGIMERRVVTKYLETGVAIVDLIIPLGKGQRELVIGDRKSGKTYFLLETMITQARQGALCIYVAIGKRQYDVLRIENELRQQKVMDSCIIVSAVGSGPEGLVYLAPYTAMTIAEYFRDQGRDVVLILDDLITHAKFHRQMSLLSGRFPGRDSYPGDIFYTHARLLERAGNFDKGSITCLPVAESLQSDLAGYIQTNIMSITDGHIFFDTELFNQGNRPAINPFLSVTRVGRRTQSPVLKDINRTLTRFLTQAQQLRQYMHFGSELTREVQQMIALQDRINMFLYQSDQVLPVSLSAYIIASLWGGLWVDITIAEVQARIQSIIDHFMKTQAFQKSVHAMVTNAKSFADLIAQVKKSG